MKGLIELSKSIVKKIKEMLSVNLGWKVFSLIFAICSWFLVINLTNPKESWVFSHNLTLSGVENLAEYHNVVVRNQNSLENTVVTMTIRGNRLDLEALNKYKNNLVASANLGIIYDFTMNGDVLTPIEIIFPAIPGVAADAFEVTSISPRNARVTLEEIVTEEKTVRVTLHGEVGEGYVALTPEVTPDEVKLKGPRSKLNQIDQVMVETTLAGETGDIDVSLPIRLLDRDMREVQDVDCFTDFVDVFIKVDKQKKVPVYAGYVGEPPEGYAVTGITWEPRALEIVGSGEEVNALTEVRLTPINVSTLTVTNTASFDIRTLDILPESVSIKNGTPNNVTVTVTIEKVIEKDVSTPVALLSTGTLSPQYSYNILSETVELTVKGIESAVTALSNDNIRMKINLDGFEAGEHLVPVDVQLPDGVELTGSPPSVRVNITPAVPVGGDETPE